MITLILSFKDLIELWGGLSLAKEHHRFLSIITLYLAFFLLFYPKMLYIDKSMM